MPESLLQMNQMDADPEMDGIVDEAFASNEFDDYGFGVEMASDEDQQMLQVLMDGIEEVIHGDQADKVVSLISDTEHPYEGIGMAAHAITLSAYMQAHRDGVELNDDIFFGENGAVQETVELLWEVAAAMNVVDVEDEEQLAASYLNAIRLLGDSILELDDPTAVQDSQEFLLELELGHPVRSEDYMQHPEDVPMEEPPMAPPMDQQQGMY